MRLLKKQSAASIASICKGTDRCADSPRCIIIQDAYACRALLVNIASAVFFCKHISWDQTFFENKVVQCLTYSSADYNGCYSLDDSVQSHDTEHHLEQSIRCCCSELCHTCIFCKQIESSEEEDRVRNGSDKGGDRHA